MNSSDIREVKLLASRLQVRDSDVIRFAVKCALMRLAPLCDSDARGHRLVPVLMESGGELLRHFELDISRLDSIVNEGLTNHDLRVEREDLRVIALHGMHRPFPGSTLGDPPRAPGTEAMQGSIDQTLRQYIYDKYRSAFSPAPGAENGNGGS
jgi:hypothetical protein